MNKWIISAIVILALLAAGAFYWTSNETAEAPLDSEATLNSDSQRAELAAFNFILDFIDSAPPNLNEETADKIMAVLSTNAKTKIKRDTIMADLASFVGVQDVPDEGVKIEEFQTVSPTEAYVVISLNYSGGPALRNIHLVKENGQWKIDRVSIPAQLEN